MHAAPESTYHDTPPPTCPWNWVRDLFGPALFTFPVLFFLMHSMDQGLTESRYAQAKERCRHLTAWHRSTGKLAPPSGTLVHQPWSLPENDLWGMPYQAVLLPGGGTKIRVYSFGPDQQSSSFGLDDDDMSLDMPKTALDRFQAERRRQWWIAVGSWAGLCALGSTLLYISHRQDTAPAGPRAI